MRLFLLVALLGGLALFPFVAMKQPWAMKIWGNVRLVAIVYAIVIFVAAIVALVANWDEIYG